MIGSDKEGPASARRVKDHVTRSTDAERVDHIDNVLVGEELAELVSRLGGNQLLENARIASEQSVPLCQDTGFTVIFLEIGQDVSLTGGDINDAVTEGVSQAYTEGYLRKSIIKNPVPVL